MMNGERHYRYRTAINRYSPLGGGATDRKKAKKRHLTEGMTEETLTATRPKKGFFPKKAFLALTRGFCPQTSQTMVSATSS